MNAALDRWIPTARLVSGLTLFAFVLCHFLNHAVGLVSLDAMQASNPLFLGAWFNPAGNAVLATAFAVHVLIALRAVYRRRTMRMARWEWAQLLAGLAIPSLLLAHVMGTRIALTTGAVQPTYPFVVHALWVGAPWEGVKQALALIVVWGHAVIGLHFWLRVKPWYARVRAALTAAALVIPTLALAGYAAAGFELLAELDRDHPPAAIAAAAKVDPDALATLMAWQWAGYAGIAGLIALPFAGRALRHAAERMKPRARVRLADGRQLRLPPGASLLEGLRLHGVPHAAVCGGRGRCTTCRVRVTAADGDLAPPNEIEARALRRIEAEPGVRLACQVRPASDLAIHPLLPPGAGAQDGRRPGGLEGEEREVTALFVDIRGSTKLGEAKLPFDVLFILNQFFAEMSLAIHETGGHYAQFNGDGLMALYGLERRDDPTRGAGRALAGAAAMLRRLNALNAALTSELPFPLRVGIGIHTGEAIVGAMGPPRAQITTAIGDTINIAARLEGLTKEYGAPLILSAHAAERAGLDAPDARRDSVTLRGRATTLEFLILEKVPELAEETA